MPCDLKMRVADLAQIGWDEDEIKLLEMEIELAKAKANREAVSMGLTRAQGEDLMARAEQKAREVAHERMHAKGVHDLNVLMSGGEANALPVAAKHGHSHEAAGEFGPAQRAKLSRLLES